MLMALAEDDRRSGMRSEERRLVRQRTTENASGGSWQERRGYGEGVTGTRERRMTATSTRERGMDARGCQGTKCGGWASTRVGRYSERRGREDMMREKAEM